MKVILPDIEYSLNEDIIQSVIKICREAGKAIMEIYETDYMIEIKKDHSPVTQADIQSNLLITKELYNINSCIPILSEEGKSIPYIERKDWNMFWLIDPLDGTKDFIKKNGEFTVNIALIKKSCPIFGVVYAPAMDLLYFGSYVSGSFIQEGFGPKHSISVSSCFPNPIKIASSRSHPSNKMNKFLSQFTNYKLELMGSSLKICRVADGSVNLYPRLGPTMEWDTAAAHAVLRASGGEVIKYGTNQPLKYNKQDLLNPEFIAGNKNIIKGLDLFN